MKRVKIGKVTAPVGIRGEVRVLPYVDDGAVFYDIGTVCIAESDYALQGVRRQKGMMVLKLESIDCRDDAERLRNAELTPGADESWALPEDVYLVSSLVGMSVLCEDGEIIGTLSDVIENPGHDLYEIQTTEGKTFLLPAVREFVRSVDEAEQCVVVRLIEGMMDP